MEPRYFPKRFKKWAALQKINLRLTDSGEFYYPAAKMAWAGWQARSLLSQRDEDAAIFNAAVQRASEIAYKMAGQEVAAEIQKIKI